jgi:Ca2+-binding RTX toxin-like protein
VKHRHSRCVKIDIGKSTVQDFCVFGKDILRNFEDFMGGGANDRATGTDAANDLDGYTGNDTLNGLDGDDFIQGNSGADRLTGGRGRDQIGTGGTDAARDIISYRAASDSTVADVGRDIILGFDSGGTAIDDKIDLSAIDGDAIRAGDQAFTFRSGNAFTLAKGEVRVQVSGSDTIIHIDLDSDSGDEMRIIVSNVTDLTAVDFIL